MDRDGLYRDLVRVLRRRAAQLERSPKVKAPDENDRHRAGEEPPPVEPFEVPDPGPSHPDTWRKCTDIGNAERLVSVHGADLHYVPAWGEWIRWDTDERVWVVDETQVSRYWFQIIARNIRKEALDAADASKEAIKKGEDERGMVLKALSSKLRQWSEKSEASPRVTAALREAQAQPGVSLRTDEIDADPNLFVCSNAGIELARTPVKVREPRREDLVTRRSKVVFGHGLDCPTWKRFLSWAMKDDAELVSYLQRAVGYSLTSDRSERVFFFLYGSGANGKSTFLTVFRALLGGYAVQMPPKLLLESPTGDRHPTELARLEGSRVVIGSDQAGTGARWNEPLIKQLTGEAELSVRGMNEDFRDILITWKLWIAANALPYGSASDAALWRRVQLIPFEASVTEAEEDHTLEHRLLCELPGILNWALEGLAAWRTGGLQPPAKVKAAVETYRASIDLVAQWIEERCNLGAWLECPMSQLYGDFAEWCKSQGIRTVMAANRLGADLEKRGFPSHLSSHYRTRSRKGLQLRVAHEPSLPYNREAT